MKIFSGVNVCDLCRKCCCGWYQIPIVEGKLSHPEIKIVCIDCVASKEFWYLDENGFLKFNSVEIIYNSSLSKQR